jgi:hypothetical protein
LVAYEIFPTLLYGKLKKTTIGEMSTKTHQNASKVVVF